MVGGGGCCTSCSQFRYKIHRLRQQTLSYGKAMLNGSQDTVCGDGRDNGRSAALQRGCKCCLIYSGQGASEQFIKKEKKKTNPKPEN